VLFRRLLLLLPDGFFRRTQKSASGWNEAADAELKFVAEPGGATNAP
jgi:hypothetical protein